MTDDEKKLMRIRRSHPYKGRNLYGSGKLTGCCPHCGAGPRYFKYPGAGRYKHCYQCGLDNRLERVFMDIRWHLRKGHDVEPERVARAISYGIQVYGDPDLDR